MPKLPEIKRDEVKFKHVKFFVCACSHCGRKQEVFSNELHLPHQCRECGRALDFNQCEFDVPD